MLPTAQDHNAIGDGDTGFGEGLGNDHAFAAASPSALITIGTDRVRK